MPPRLLPVFVLGATLAPTVGSCRTTPPPLPSEQEVLAVLETQQDAWNRGDVDAFVELGYWRSPELTFFSGGTVTKGYDPLVERYRRRYVESGEGMGELAFADLEVFPLGPDAAMARGRWQLERRASEAIGGLFTLILRRIDGSWRIVHDHTSVAEGPE